MSEKRIFPIANGKLLTDLDADGHRIVGLPEEPDIEVVAPDASASEGQVADAKATYKALGGKADIVDGKVPAAQLPSYVDDVIERANKNLFPSIGESGKIYVALDTNKTYRWGGSTYVEISESLALGETAETAFPGNRGVALEARVESNATAIAEEATRAQEAEGEIAEAADGAQSTADSALTKANTLIGSDAGKSARTIAGEEVAKIVDAAPEAYDTLKEIAEYIASDEEGAAAMAASIVTAQSTAEDAQSTAYDAVIMVSDAVGKADSAQTTADEALSTATNAIPRYPFETVLITDSTLTLTPYACTVLHSDGTAFEVALGGEAGKAVRDCVLVVNCVLLETAPTIRWSEYYHPRTDAETDFACVAGKVNVYWITEFDMGQYAVAGWQVTEGGNA